MQGTWLKLELNEIPLQKNQEKINIGSKTKPFNNIPWSYDLMMHTRSRSTTNQEPFEISGVF